MGASYMSGTKKYICLLLRFYFLPFDSTWLVGWDIWLFFMVIQAFEMV